MCKSEKYKELINLYLEGKISSTQLEQLQEYLQDPDCVKILEETFDLPVSEDEVSEDEKSLHAESSVIFQKIMSDERVQDSLNKKKTKYRYEKLRYVAAAAVFIAVAYFSFFLLSETSNPPDIEKTDRGITAIVPGGDKAFIILDDGSQVDLDKVSKDSLFTFEGISMIKNDDGSVSYSVNADFLAGEEIKYHTIVTPRGGQYQLTLSDGTQVWLNASSSLKFPLRFDDKVREVELQGEAYFEVAKQNHKSRRVPFIVQSGSQELEVLGTIFNIQAYNEDVITTLVEGKVRLGSVQSDDKIELNPQDQAVLKKNQKHFKVEKVNPMYAMAWKDGNFAFKKASIKEVMEEVARWYDVEVEYRTTERGSRFTGTISKFEQLDKLLQFIEMTGSVQFSTEGRKIVVQ